MGEMTRYKEEVANYYDDDEEDDEDKELTIEENFGLAQLEDIKRIFDTGHRFGLKKPEFKAKIFTKYNIEITDAELDVIFAKIDFNKDDYINWDEFVSYLALELDCKQTDFDRDISIESPIVEEPDFLPSGHRNAVVHVTFCPTVLPNGKIDKDDGKYVTMSKDGVINFWTLDLRLLRSFKDFSPNFEFRQTWVTNFACLANVSVVVTSSTERELRFYSTTSKGFHLILVIVVMPFCVNHMYYHFTEDATAESLLICGDLGGHLRVMEFNTINKGPFKQTLGVETVMIKWEHVIKGKLPNMKAYNILNIHTDWVKEVAYYKLLGTLVSCSSSITAMYMGDTKGIKGGHIFQLKRGIETFCLNEDSPLIVSGSLDCILRLWNPFVPQKPVASLRGHHASVIKIFLQDNGRKIFSLDKDRILKVWDSTSQACLQTYAGFVVESSPIKEFCGYYNPTNHLFVLAGFKMAAVTCGQIVDEARLDGKTHSDTVSVVLFNRLFKCVITCGLDSNIVIWNLWTNQCRKCIRMAHSTSPFGVELPVPITAATFDPPHQFLLTGAGDGTMKMWDFNTGLCLRNMNVGKGQEITKLLWIPNRILAVGWSNRVTEFSDSFSGRVSSGKTWELRHTDDILATDFKPGQALATSTYNGDLIFWRLETGQSYRRYNVTQPTGLYKLEYIREKGDKKLDMESLASKSSKGSTKGRKVQNRTLLLKKAAGKMKGKGKGKGKQKGRPKVRRGRKVKETTKPILQRPIKHILAPKISPHIQRNLAVYCVLFLKSRETRPDQATVLTATENGMIQAWSHHLSGSYLESFRAVHVDRDYVSCMISDPEDEYLFTATTLGYVKIWLLKNYCLPPGTEVPICMPLLRLQFPFLIFDRFRNRAKSALVYQPHPLLVNSYKGHTATILWLEYVAECKILLTGSADKTARVWTLSGRYIGTLGQHKPWPKVKWNRDAEKINDPKIFRIPPDLIRKGSYTSLKVFQGAPPIATRKYVAELDLSLTPEERKYGIYGKPLDRPILGHHHSFPEKDYRRKGNPIVDESMMKIPVFIYLRMFPWLPIPPVLLPRCIEAVRNKENDSIKLEVDY